MSGRRHSPAWWQDIARSEHFNGAEWLLLGVSALALVGVLVVLVRVVS